MLWRKYEKKYQNWGLQKPWRKVINVTCNKHTTEFSYKIAIFIEQRKFMIKIEASESINAIY